MANPRKFSEKIALHNQKQAEETAAFERIMQEVSVTRVIGMQPPRGTTAHLTPHPQAYLRPYLGGSLPNVNQIAANPQMELHHQVGFDDNKHPMRHPARFDSRMRPYGYTHRRVMPLEIPNRHRVAHFDGQPGQYAGPYLSPPPESSWRSFALSRTNSDSALHQSVMNPNPQDPFNPSNNQMHHQGRRDINEINFNNMPPSYKALLENKKLEQHLQSGNRPKSCEAPNISLLPSGDSPTVMQTGTDGSSIPLCGNGTVPVIPSSISPGLSHVTQIGNNTGSLPDLTNLHIPSPLSNPIDYDEVQPQQQQHQHQQQSNQNSLYNQARSTGNLPAASAISPHLGGIPRGPASPNRSRRHTHNGPSPLSLGSPEHARRIRYPNVTSPKMSGVKPELKSPPLGGSYSYPYPPQPGPPIGGWPLPSPEHAGSPSHAQAISGRGIPPQVTMHPHHMAHQQQAGGQQLRIDVSAAAKVGQQQGAYTRAPQGSSVTSPLTSPTSPTSQCSQASFSPITSPRHEFTTGSNPALSEAYYRTEMPSMQPLQHQFEHFHVVNDNGSPQHRTGAPPMYSTLTALAENSTDGNYGMLHGNSISLGHGLHNLNSIRGKHNHFPNNISKIPDIVFTGADDANLSKGSLGPNDFGGVMSHDLGSDYFPGDELKANLGLEELQMLDDTNIITDPVMEDSLQLDSL